MNSSAADRTPPLDQSAPIQIKLSASFTIETPGSGEGAVPRWILGNEVQTMELLVANAAEENTTPRNPCAEKRPSSYLPPLFILPSFAVGGVTSLVRRQWRDVISIGNGAPPTLSPRSLRGVSRLGACVDRALSLLESPLCGIITLLPSNGTVDDVCLSRGRGRLRC